MICFIIITYSTFPPPNNGKNNVDELVPNFNVRSISNAVNSKNVMSATKSAIDTKMVQIIPMIIRMTSHFVANRNCHVN